MSSCCRYDGWRRHMPSDLLQTWCKILCNWSRPLTGVFVRQLLALLSLHLLSLSSESRHMLQTIFYWDQLKLEFPLQTEMCRLEWRRVRWLQYSARDSPLSRWSSRTPSLPVDNALHLHNGRHKQPQLLTTAKRILVCWNFLTSAVEVQSSLQFSPFLPVLQHVCSA